MNDLESMSTPGFPRQHGFRPKAPTRTQERIRETLSPPDRIFVPIDLNAIDDLLRLLCNHASADKSLSPDSRRRAKRTRFCRQTRRSSGTGKFSTMINTHGFTETFLTRPTKGKGYPERSPLRQSLSQSPVARHLREILVGNLVEIGHSRRTPTKCFDKDSRQSWRMSHIGPSSRHSQKLRLKATRLARTIPSSNRYGPTSIRRNAGEQTAAMGTSPSWWNCMAAG